MNDFKLLKKLSKNLEAMHYYYLQSSSDDIAQKFCYQTLLSQKSVFIPNFMPIPHLLLMTFFQSAYFGKKVGYIFFSH